MKFEVGKEYKTRDGLRAIIYDVNYREDYPIAGKVLCEDDEWVMDCWTEAGVCVYNDDNEPSPDDLILPELITLKDDFGTQLPRAIKFLPVAKEGFKLKYLKGGIPNKDNSTFEGYCWNLDKWVYEKDWGGWLSNNHYLELIPIKQYWSKPEDIPNNGNIWMKHKEGVVYTKIESIDKNRFETDFDSIAFKDYSLQNYRWSLTPYGEGKECLIEN